MCLVIVLVLVFVFVLWCGMCFLLCDGMLVGGLMVGVFFGVEFLCIFIGLGYMIVLCMVVFFYIVLIFIVFGLYFFVLGEYLCLC